ncbi:MAG: aminomethyl-transferring glycine dehydrogenase subunit GcvPB [bacterium]
MESNWNKRQGLGWEEPVIFERTREGGEQGKGLIRPDVDLDLSSRDLPEGLSRQRLPRLPEITERRVVQHFSRLSSWNFGVDHGFYPLGSCTMKYNPKLGEHLASLPGFRELHPEQPEKTVEGALLLMAGLQEMLEEIAGMEHVCLSPAAGAQGELTGMLMIRAYHESKGHPRKKVLIPDTAHGTNPASSALAGYEVREIKTSKAGILKADTIAEHMDEDVAALMMTNPNTLGLFESDIADIAELLHSHDALLYCDGANLNATMGITRPGDAGVDVIQFNLHKTFATPHGGGGPGSGPVGVSEKLLPFLPLPVLRKDKESKPYLDWSLENSIGRMTTYYGHFLVMVKAYAYLRRMGPEGIKQASRMAVLNANYLRVLLRDTYHTAHPDHCMHEVVFSDKRMPNQVETIDIAKRLMDFGFHPPTIYFPLVVHGALMTEPTETEDKAILERFAEVMKQIAKEAALDPETVKTAPHTTPLARLDEVKAARKPMLRYQFSDDRDE